MEDIDAVPFSVLVNLAAGTSTLVPAMMDEVPGSCMLLAT
jgi:hypothetical protein